MTNKGDQYLLEAEDELNKGGGGACCGGAGRARIHEEQACALYIKAGNAFKVSKEWQKAGNVFAEAASIQIKNDRKTEAGMNYVEAAKCYKKVNPASCEEYLEKAGQVYCDVGRGKTAAKHIQSLAEIYDEQKQHAKALEKYQQASEMFAAEDLTSSTTKCQIGVATNAARLDDYLRAAEIFEELGNSALSNKLLKYTCSEHFLKAGLCHLAANLQNVSALRTKINEYKDASPAFADSRESHFLLKLAEAVSKEDVDQFNEAVRSYESVTQLPDLEKSIVGKIRKNVGPDLR